jgi:membrane protein
VSGFIEDNALSHGAAMAFYSATSMAPVLVIVIAIAGLVFGHDAAQNGLAAPLTGLLGQQSAEMLETAIKSTSNKTSGTWATIIGVVTRPEGSTVSRLVRARAASLGLVAALGFLLMVSLVISAGISALGHFIDAVLPFGKFILAGLNFVISFGLISLLFAAIYKVLPDRPLLWPDVWVGAIVTSALFTIGKSLIGWYIGSSAVASSYGAAGALIIVLLWVYYSAQIFLLGAEFTYVYSRHDRGRQRSTPQT